MSENIERNTIKKTLCVISKMVYGEEPYTFRDIQTNNTWAGNPYSEDYAVVPDEMVQDILLTGGYCDIMLNEDGTEVNSFVRRQRPEPEEPASQGPTEVEQLRADVDYIAVMTGVDL